VEETDADLMPPCRGRLKQVDQREPAQCISVSSPEAAPEWHSDAHLEARGFFVEYDELCTGHQRYDGSPLVFNDIRGYETFVRAAGMGEHNRTVLGGLLGYTDDRLAELEERGVIVDRPPA